MASDVEFSEEYLLTAIEVGKRFASEPAVPGIEHANLCAFTLRLLRERDEVEEVLAAGREVMDLTKEWHGGLCRCRKCQVRERFGLALAALDQEADRE